MGIRTWTLSDGHAGNARQVQALARALGLAVERDWVLRPNRLARALAPRVWPGAQAAFGPAFAQAFAATSVPNLTIPNLAIGCGRQAALATRLLCGRVLPEDPDRRSVGMPRAQPPRQTQTARCQVVQILDPRLHPRHWDVVVAPEHDALHGENVITALGSLHPVDDVWLAQARAEFAQFSNLPRPRIAVLVGGPSRHAPLQRDTLLTTLARVTDAVRAANGSLLLSASRRTPHDWKPALRDAATALPGLAWFNTGDGRNPYPGLLAWADAILCSADSVNMLSEACATRVPVFVIDPDQAHGRPQRFIGALRERGRIATLDDAQTMVTNSTPAEPLRETERVAAQVAQRLQLRSVGAATE